MSGKFDSITRETNLSRTSNHPFPCVSLFQLELWSVSFHLGSLLSRAMRPGSPEPRPRVTRRDRRRRAKDRARRLQGAYLMDVQDEYSDTAR